jgi:hypothetical protein
MIGGCSDSGANNEWYVGTVVDCSAPDLRLHAFPHASIVLVVGIVPLGEPFLTRLCGKGSEDLCETLVELLEADGNAGLEGVVVGVLVVKRKVGGDLHVGLEAVDRWFSAEPGEDVGHGDTGRAQRHPVGHAEDITFLGKDKAIMRLQVKGASLEGHLCIVVS